LGADRRFKLCDLGSATDQAVKATNAASMVAIEEDIQKHTTLQYRAPEMIDLYSKWPIDERVDIWVRSKPSSEITDDACRPRLKLLIRVFLCFCAEMTGPWVPAVQAMLLQNTI